MAQLWKTCQVAQPDVGEVLRPLQMESCQVIDVTDAVERLIGHLAIRVQRGESLMPHQCDDGVPVARGLRGALIAAFVAGGDGDRARREGLPGWLRGDEFGQRAPTLEPMLPRNQKSCIVERGV